jgi:hypothetical protein
MLAPRGLERAITTAVLAVAAAVLETLVLGLVGLGANTLALTAAAAVTWVAATTMLPRPDVAVSTEIAAWWGGLQSPWRVVVATLAGAGAAWVASELRYPSIGFDSTTYHYAMVAGWIQNGHPGSILTVGYDLPFGNYPLTNEVALTWSAAISRSFVPLSLWSPATFLLFGTASWLTLRNLDVPRIVAGLGAVAIVTAPLAVHQLSEPQTDLPALAWLASTAALCTGARRRPALLVPAVVSAGLTIGTKTTPVVPLAAALAVGVYCARASLRPLARWLALAVAGAFAVGGIWYARNLVQHGSPLWPFTPAPWGDPTPGFLAHVHTSLLQRPEATLHGQLDGFASRLGGGVLLLGGALLVLIQGLLGVGVARSLRRELLVAGGVAFVAFLAYAAAPGTGIQPAGYWFGPFSTLRYVLPAVCAATVAVALAARAGGAAFELVAVWIAAAVVWNLVNVARLGSPYVPAASTLAVGAVAGLLVLGAATAASRAPALKGPRVGVVPRAASLAVAAVAVGAVLAPASNGYMERHTKVANSTALGPDLTSWFAAQRGFESGHQTISFVSRAVDAALAGDHFTHALRVIPADASCAQVQAFARRSIVVVATPNFLLNFIGNRPYDTGRCLDGQPPAYHHGFFTVYSPTMLGTRTASRTVTP